MKRSTSNENQQNNKSPNDSIQVSKAYVWPIRLAFIALTIVVADLVLKKIAQGYVISAGGTKFLAGATVFYTNLMKYFALDFVLVLLVVRTVLKEPEQEKAN